MTAFAAFAPPAEAGFRLVAGRPDAAEWVQRLTKVALKDADGAELDGALRTVETLFEDA